jgi:hypothetical protein
MRLSREERKEKVLEAVKLLSDSLPYHVLPYGFISNPLVSHIGDCRFILDKFQTISDIGVISEAEFRRATISRLEIISQHSKDIQGVFCFIHKPYLIPLLSLVTPYLTSFEYNKILRDSWTRTEFPNHNNLKQLVCLFQKSKPKSLMTAEERLFLSKLPAELIIYRGLQKEAKKRGLSWTLNKEKGIWFAKRFNNHGKLLRAKIKKEFVFAYFNNRAEDEVVVNPFKLREITEVPI